MELRMKRGYGDKLVRDILSDALTNLEYDLEESNLESYSFDVRRLDYLDIPNDLNQPIIASVKLAGHNFNLRCRRQNLKIRNTYGYGDSKYELTLEKVA
jgi:hypothetical protein